MIDAGVRHGDGPSATGTWTDHQRNCTLLSGHSGHYWVRLRKRATTPAAVRVLLGTLFAFLSSANHRTSGSARTNVCSPKAPMQSLPPGSGVPLQKVRRLARERLPLGHVFLCRSRRPPDRSPLVASRTEPLAPGLRVLPVEEYSTELSKLMSRRIKQLPICTICLRVTKWIRCAISAKLAEKT